MLIDGSLLIGAQSVSAGERTHRAIDPQSGEALDPSFVFASAAQVDAAALLAEAAFDSYRMTGPEDRAAFLHAIADAIMALGDNLLDRAMAETGLTRSRLDAERARTVNQLRLFAQLVRAGEWLDLRIDTALPHRRPLPRPDLRLRQVALGPVAVFGSSNFPLAFSVAGGDTAAALAAGCPVIVKGHPAHPGTGELVGRAIQSAVREHGLPEGVFSLLNGAIETGTNLVKHPAIKAVGFTGSRAGGLALVAAAAARHEPIPVYAEMSSINPVFLFPAALADRADGIGHGFAGSLTLDAGQYCTNPGLVVGVSGPDLDRFLGAVDMAMSGIAPSPMLTPSIFNAFETGISAFARHPGVRVGASGAPAEGVNRASAAFFVTDATTFLGDPSLANEVFGASGLLVVCDDAIQFASIAKHLEGQLTATLQLEADDYPAARTLVPVLERKVGRILVNQWPAGVEVSDAMVHGGPYPATSDSRSTSVGTLSIRRFLRPVSYQNLPDALLPPELLLHDEHPLPVLVNGQRVLPGTQG